MRSRGKQLAFKISFLICLAATLLPRASATQAGEPDKVPLIVVSPRSWDFGEVEEGRVEEKVFVVKNTGDEDLIVESVYTSCVCTTAEISARQIAPGETAKLKVNYDTEGMPPGRDSKDIYIDSNDPVNPVIKATISTVITGPEAGGEKGKSTALPIINRVVIGRDGNSENPFCAVYITGIGCPACASVEPVVLSDWLSEFPALAVIEYEIYKAREHNQEVWQNYISSFVPPAMPGGIPFLILEGESFVGPEPIKGAAGSMRAGARAECPMPSGELVPFANINLSDLPGRPRIWTKNRVFILEPGSDPGPFGGKRDSELRELIAAEDVNSVLGGIDFIEVTPEPVHTSRGQIEFQNAVMIGNWRLQWDGEEPLEARPGWLSLKQLPANWPAFLIPFLLGSFFTLLLVKRKKVITFIRLRKREFFIVCASLFVLAAFFLLAANVSPSFLKGLGYSLPLPVFTFVIAIIDGFNPCNMFVLTMLLALLISSSASRKRFYLVGLVFIFVVFCFYFLFMAAWLNIFNYIGYAGRLRIIIAYIAIAAGIFNCKELFFFKKGVSLTIPEKNKGPLYARMRKVSGIINKGSLPALIFSSAGLAVFASLIEIPCTAGFPILYTAVLSSHAAAGGLRYIFYLVFYNIVYVIPLLAIIVIFGITFRARKITRRQVRVIKFIGGLIMILLGVILLANPQLIGAGF